MRLAVWLYPGNAAWHFVTVPKKVSATIRDRFGDGARGWGSLPVTAAVGSSRWDTSIFPDKKSGSYLLPLKAAVRKNEGISIGDTVRLALEIRA